MQYRFDCGSGPGSVRVESLAVNDGYWHTVSVERISRNVRITVDDIYMAEGSGPGTNDALNLHSNDVFFGAQVTITIPRTRARTRTVTRTITITITITSMRPRGADVAPRTP